MQLFLILFLIFTPLSHAQTLSFFRGEVLSSPQEDGPFQRTKKGAKLSYGSYLKVGSKSLAIVSFPGGSTLKVDPESLVEISEIKNEATQTHVYRLLKGSILSKFNSSDAEELIVESDHVALAVRGTEFFFGQEENDFYAAVNEGEVAVVRKNNYDFESLTAGKGMVVEKNGRLTKPADYQWSKNLNWDFRSQKENFASGFRGEKLRGLRKSEVGKRIASLRKRKRQRFEGKFKNRLKQIKNFRRDQKRKIQKLKRESLRKAKRQAREKAKKTIERKTRKSIKGKVQDFKSGLKKRGILRRRRN